MSAFLDYENFPLCVPICLEYTETPDSYDDGLMFYIHHNILEMVRGYESFMEHRYMLSDDEKEQTEDVFPIVPLYDSENLQTANTIGYIFPTKHTVLVALGGEDLKYTYYDNKGKEKVREMKLESCYYSAVSELVYDRCFPCLTIQLEDDFIQEYSNSYFHLGNITTHTIQYEVSDETNGAMYKTRLEPNRFITQKEYKDMDYSPITILTTSPFYHYGQEVVNWGHFKAIEEHQRQMKRKIAKSKSSAQKVPSVLV